MTAPKVVSSIYNQIRSRILFSGPITVAEYMKMALTASNNESQGYYMHQDVFGQRGDFITSPEISQLFGEMIGVWGIDTWRRIGGPKYFNIVELGPGRGTLAKDILRVFHQLRTETERDVNLHLVEISPYLAKVQYETLCGAIEKKLPSLDHLGTGSNSSSNEIQPFLHGVTNDAPHVPVSWHHQLQTVPKGFNFYIAHEFFDALPIHKLQRVNDLWREVLVDIDPISGAGTPDKFRFVISRHETPVIKVLQSVYPSILTDSRSDLEFSLVAAQMYEQLTQRLEEDGGILLIVDYGHDGDKGDTFRAFRRHKLQDPLGSPGEADLTADIDFSIVKKIIGEKALVYGPITQSELLGRVGIEVRMKNLYHQCKTDQEKEQLVSGYKMLMEDMGNRFKCLALFPKILEEFRTKLKIAAFDHD